MSFIYFLLTQDRIVFIDISDAVLINYIVQNTSTVLLFSACFERLACSLSGFSVAFFFRPFTVFSISQIVATIIVDVFKQEAKNAVSV